MNKKEYDKLLSTSIKDQRIKDPVIWDYLKKHPYYAKNANKEGVELVVIFTTYGKKTGKFFSLVPKVGRSQIITKTTLFEYGKKKTNFQKVTAIFRKLIEPQIKSFADKHRQISLDLIRQGRREEAINFRKCAISGRPLHTCKTAVDHIVPFRKLLDDWSEIVFKTRDFKTFCNTNVLVKGNKVIWGNTDWAPHFVQWHLENAELQMTCFQENLKLSSKGYSSSSSSGYAFGGV